MAEKQNDNAPKKRKRQLIKSTDTSENVLKKLKEVRQTLQDSLKHEKDIDNRNAEKASNIKHRTLIKKETAIPEKADANKIIQKSQKSKKRVSDKRLARVNYRVKARMDKLKGLSRQKKAIIIVWAVLMTVPLVFLTTLSVVGLEFNFEDFGLTYNENKPGNVMLSFGVRNPSFLPAQLGVFELELFSEDGIYIGKATNNDFLSIMPYESKTLYVTLAFNEEEGGKWWSDWLSDLVLTLNIGTLTYNGIAVDASAVPPIELDTGPIIRDMISGLLDIEELLGGLDLEGMLPSGEEEPTSSGTMIKSSSEKITLDPYTNAKKSTMYQRMLPQLSQFDDIGGNLSFAMSENEDEFNFGLSATFGLGDLISSEDLGGIDIGPIKMDNLDVQLVVNTEQEYPNVDEINEDEDWWTHYNTPVAKLFSTAQNEIYIADPKDRNSIFAMNLTIFKDNPNNLIKNDNGAKVHPSALIDWDAPAEEDNSIQHFLAGTGEIFGGYDVAWKEFPSWYFLYNLLSEGGLDCGILINNVDINIFGLDIKDLSIPMEVLPPIALEDGTLDPDNFLRIAPDYGLAGMLKHVEKSIIETPAMAFLGLPPSQSSTNMQKRTAANITTIPGLPPEQDLDSFLNDFIAMVEFPSIDPFEDIEETWGNNASLHIGLPITLNNSMLNLYMGFEGMQISIASDSDTSEEYKEVLLLTMKGTSDNMVYIPGIDSMVDMMVSVDILKNETIQPHAAKLLRRLIEDWTLDGIITAKFDKLVLFKENYTYGKFDVAIPLVLDLEDILVELIAEMVPGLVEGLVGDTSSLDGSDGKIKMSPIALLYSLWSPLPSLLGVAAKSDTFLQAAGSNHLNPSQEGEESDPINEMINDLINDLIGSLLGDALGSEMEFNLGFNATVSEGKWTKFTIHIGDFYVDDFFLTIGLGDTDIRLQSKNKYGEWEDIIGIEIDDYFEVKAQKREDIVLSIKIYETQALCDFVGDFIDEFFDPKKTNTLDLKFTGITTLNLSGIYMPDLQLSLALEDLDTGIDGTEMIDSLFDMLYDIELDGEGGSPQLLNLWAGPFNQIPFISQSIDLDSLIHIGEISIDDITETHFANISKGVGQVKLTIGSTDDPTVNYLMSMDIKKLVMSLYDKHPKNDPSAKRMLDISIDDGPGLDYASNRQLEITITIYKSEECESFLNKLINTLDLDGWLNFSGKFEVFGCDIELKPTFLPAINMSRLPIDVTTLLGGVLNPFAAPFLGKTIGPRTAQNINTDSIFENVLQFGIKNIVLGEFNNDVGPLNYDNPALTVDLALWIQTFFNMSINSMDLKLLDAGLYEALHLEGGFDFEDVVREAEIARVILDGDTAHFNSCIPYSQQLYGYQKNDPSKPYVINKTGDFSYDSGEQRWESGADFGNRVQFELDRNKLDDDLYPYRRNIDEGVNSLEFNKTGFTSTNYLYLEKPTTNELKLQIQLFNKSHGDWETRYDRKYWRALGGPYFPPQYYGKEYGGYPDHYYIYHKYYSPLVGLLQKATGLLTEEGIATDTEAIKDIISSIAIGGSISINVFSMDIDIDLNNPKINAMIEPLSGLLLGLTGIAIKDYVGDVVNPWSERLAPKEAVINNLMLSQDIDDIFGDILDFDVFPLDDSTVFHGYTIPAMAELPNHHYNPKQMSLDGNEVRTWDGSNQWIEGPTGAYMAESSDAVYEDYNRDPEDIEGYTGSLEHPYFDNKELFHKDKFYDQFKRRCDNYYISTGRKYNPFFETYYSEIHPYTGKVDYMRGEKIDDPANWPLKWNEDKNGRISTAAVTIHLGVLMEIPLTVLSGCLDLYMEDPVIACSYMPYGYLWINDSVRLMELDQILDDPNDPNDLYDQYTKEHFNDIYQFIGDDQGDVYADMVSSYYNDGTIADENLERDYRVMALCACGQNGTRDDPINGHAPTENGRMDDPGWNILINVRAFEGIGADLLFEILAQTLLSEVPLILQGNVNVSFLGYELYNIFVPNDLARFGDPTEFYQRCEEYLNQQGSGGGLGNIGIPHLNGTASGEPDTKIEYDDIWPHYLLIGDPMELPFPFPLESILPYYVLLNALADTPIDDYLSIGLGFGYISIEIDLHLDPEGYFYMYLEIGLSEIYAHIDINIPNIAPLLLWITTLTVDIIVGGYSFPIQTFIPLCAMDLVPGSHPFRDPLDPFDFRYNPYKNFSIPNYLKADDIEMTVETPELLSELIGMLLGGEDFIFDLLINLEILFPPAFNNFIDCPFTLEDLL